MKLLAFALFLLPAWGWAVRESHGHLGLENTTYFERLTETPDTGSYSSLTADFFARASSRKWGEAQADAGIVAFLDGYKPLVNVREIFVGSPENRQWTGAKLSGGRKLQRWSEIDRLWGLGIWQPRFRWDYLHPEPQGLTGVFLEVYEEDLFHFVAFGSPLFIPEMEPGVTAEQGKVMSQSPWFNSPASQVQFYGQETPIAYSIRRPDIAKMLQNPGGALMLQLGSLNKGPWFRAATAYKPVNQLLLSVNSSLEPREVAAAQATSTLSVEVTPRVAYHHVYEVAGGYELPRMGAGLALLKDRPVLKEEPDSVIWQTLSPTFMVVPALRFKLGRSRENAGSLELSWFRRWGGDAADQGRLASAEGSLFEPRFDYENAASVALETPAFYTNLGTLHYRGQAVYEASGQGVLLSNTLVLQTRRTWTVNVGVDLIGQVDELNDPGRGLLSRFRQNDRIHGGVGYVF